MLAIERNSTPLASHPHGASFAASPRPFVGMTQQRYCSREQLTKFRKTTIDTSAGALVARFE